MNNTTIINNFNSDECDISKIKIISSNHDNNYKQNFEI